MKALTLRQPWATLVALGVKKIETRSWKTEYRGPLAIHAAKQFSKSARQHCYQAHILDALIEAGHDPGLAIFRLPLGVVVAICTLIQIVRITKTNAPKEPELSFGDYTLGRWAWILHDIKRLPEPIPARGFLGLWNWEIENIKEEESC